MVEGSRIRERTGRTRLLERSDTGDMIDGIFVGMEMTRVV